jgi:hypothetical protein
LPTLIDIFGELIGRQGTGFDVAAVLIEVERRAQLSQSKLEKDA